MPATTLTSRPASEAAEVPVLTAVVIARDDERRVERAVRSVVTQKCPEPFEVIVVVSGTDRTAEIVRRQFPQVTLVELAGVALPGRARNAGLWRARGRFITFPGSHVELQPGALAARLVSHQAGWAMVSTGRSNGTRTRAGWASYFLDNAGMLPNRPSGPLEAAPQTCSYLTSALVEIGGFPEDMRAGEDTAVNLELFARGYSAYWLSAGTFTHHSPCTTTRRLIGHHFQRGRGGGRLLAYGRVPPDVRFPSRSLLRVLPGRLWWVSIRVMRWGSGMRHEYVLSLPLVWAAMVAYFFGIRFELSHERSDPAGELVLDELRQAADDTIDVRCRGERRADRALGVTVEGQRDFRI